SIAPRGGLEVRSSEPDVARRVRVVAEPYAFDDVGTVFTVQRDPAFVELSVREGLVLVSRGGETVTTIGAGKTWRGRTNEAPLAASASGVGVTPLAPPKPEES